MPSSSPDCNSVHGMASRGRRGVPAREGEQGRDEPRREDQGEQQAPAPQGPVLPPPPPVDYVVFMQGLVQAMQTQTHTQAALQDQLEAQQAHERADVWWSSILRTRFEDGAQHGVSAGVRNEAVPGGEEGFSEEARSSFSERPVASGSSQVSSQHSPSGKKECPHCGRAHGGTECWKLAGKCLKCGSSEHRIKDCPRLQQGGQRGAGPAPTVAAAAPVTGRPGRPRAPARLSIRSSVLDEVIEQQKADPRLQELVGKAGIASDEDGAEISTSSEEIVRSDSERE
ncbi:hypothetical protein Taro_001125 [Colocasia esculenta]|uniref:CCHC-type domain-containing protein n=1 Tax=Colocasia esculenta TaxID=4460 RepID=A0A843T925_COLES|nr:hypothetical protein [Colocasia esculenta]